MTQSDQLPTLSPAEQQFIAKLNKDSSKEEVLANLKNSLQAATEVELATLPLYLFTYYSLVRNAQLGENISPQQLFTNKAGALIMSVAVEEMLHMTLASNLYYALFGQPPAIYGKAPASFPTQLPYHAPISPTQPFEASLAKFGYDQLATFLGIEAPEGANALPSDRNWTSIGQLYSYVRCLILCDWLTDDDFKVGPAAHQVQPFNYSPNNIDTVCPSKAFDPWKPAPPATKPAWVGGKDGAADVATYGNSADSHTGPTELVTVSDKLTAQYAIDTICDQGEGFAVTTGHESPTDDPTKSEYSHYYKFLLLQAQMTGYTTDGRPTLPVPPAPITPAYSVEDLGDLVVNYQTNPANSLEATEAYRPIIEFSDSLFSYMLLMTEATYYVPPAEQKHYFNVSLHRSMIWVLDGYISEMRSLSYTTGGETYALAPTFKNVSFLSRQTAFTELKAQGETLITYITDTWLSGGVSSDIVDTMNSLVGRIEQAISKTSKDGHPMHLPDVGPYFPN
jgi:hypothetical protein